MPKNIFLRVSAGTLLAALVAASRLSADVIETKSGARIVGKIARIEAGSVYVSTDFAGDIVIKQGQVTAITTDAPVGVRLASGAQTEGRIATANGILQIAAAGATVAVPVQQLAATWPAGTRENQWKFEATVDIEGTAGNKTQLGTQAGFSAKLITPRETLDYYAGYNRQVTDGAKSADQLKIGVDYTNNLTDRASWFARDEAGFDHIMDIRLYDTAAVGYGYELVKSSVDSLTARAGVAYRYDDYEDPSVATLSSAAADFELAHDLKEHNWELVNKLTVVPAFSDFHNVAATQDSYYQVPLLNPAWKLRIGVSNEYEGEPGPGIEKLDTTYYTRLILDWQ
jgi:putative salt-induced outer membrane protein YdiY